MASAHNGRASPAPQPTGRTACTLLDLPLVEQMLPRLSAVDMGSLACTCRQLHALLMSTGEEIWQQAAAPVFGPAWAVQQTTRNTSQSIRLDLLRYSEACKGLRSGTFSKGPNTMQTLPGLCCYT